jgi:isopentenyl-diphosphate delta-isomerase type 1
MVDEIFDVVDEQDRVIGQELRRIVHQRGLRHRAVHVLIFNSRGEVFLQQRSPFKDMAPNTWDSSASGHLNPGESYDDCAVRELREELGVTLPCPLKPLFKIDSSPETGQEFVWVYSGHSEGPFQLHPEEIQSGGWFSPEQVTDWMKKQPADFAPALPYIWARL